MFQAISCRLCINICNGHRSLYDDDGRRNEVYALTEKYFSSLLLDKGWVDHCTAVCMECWAHMFEFHSFQQSVLLAQKMSVLNTQTATVTKKDDGELAGTEFSVNATKEQSLNGAEDIEKASTSFISQQRDNYNVDLHTALAIKPELEDWVIDGGNISSSEDDTDQQGNVQAKAEYTDYVVTDVSHEYQEASGFAPDVLLEEPGRPSNQNEVFDETTDSATESEGFAKSASSDEEMTLAAYAKRKEAKATKRRKKPSAKRPQTGQEFDELIAQWRPNLECSVCSESCSSFSLLRQHFAEQHSSEECHIRCCQRNLYQRHEIERHINYHAAGNPFKCKQCCKVYTKMGSLRRHQQKTHSGQEIKKPINFQAEGSPFKCEQCGKVYTKMGSLRRHLERTHSGKPSNEDDNKISSEAVSQTPMYSCSKCGNVYKALYSLRRHNRLIHMEPAKTRMKCKFCNKLFTCRATYHTHMARHKLASVYTQQGHKVRKIYKCNTCDKVYKAAFSLREHQATHSGQPLYRCKHCTKTFKYRSNLSAHFGKEHPNEHWKVKKDWTE